MSKVTCILNDVRKTFDRKYWLTEAPVVFIIAALMAGHCGEFEPSVILSMVAGGVGMWFVGRRICRRE